MPNNNTDYRKEKMIKALKKSLGIVQTACDAVGISRPTHYNWLREDSDYREKVDEVLEIRLDLVEGKLLQNIKSNNQRAIEYYLNTKGKSRGYGSGVIDDSRDKTETEWDVRESFLEDDEGEEDYND